MKLSTLENYKHSRPIYNTTQFAAYGIANRCRGLGWHNLRYGYMPPVIEGISLEPSSEDYTPTEEDSMFEPTMFRIGGFLHEELLNHYIVLHPFGVDASFSINAGYLMHHFVLDERLGYQELGRLLASFRERLKLVPLKEVLEESSAENSDTSGNDSKGT